MKVETCGDSWRVVKSVLIFILYIHLLFFLSLVSKPSSLGIDLSCTLSLSSLPLLPFRYRICSYFV